MKSDEGRLIHGDKGTGWLVTRELVRLGTDVLVRR